MFLPIPLQHVRSVAVRARPRAPSASPLSESQGRLTGLEIDDFQRHGVHGFAVHPPKMLAQSCIVKNEWRASVLASRLGAMKVHGSAAQARSLGWWQGKGIKIGDPNRRLTNNEP
jgi:hypothetical protein